MAGRNGLCIIGPLWPGHRNLPSLFQGVGVFRCQVGRITGREDKASEDGDGNYADKHKNQDAGDGRNIGPPPPSRAPHYLPSTPLEPTKRRILPSLFQSPSQAILPLVQGRGNGADVWRTDRARSESGDAGDAEERHFIESRPRLVPKLYQGQAVKGSCWQSSDDGTTSKMRMPGHFVVEGSVKFALCTEYQHRKPHYSWLCRIPYLAQGCTGSTVP